MNTTKQKHTESKKMMSKGYFFCGDILGFSKIIMNLGPEKISERIQSWISIIENAASKYEIERYQLFSDTVFAVVDSDSLHKLVNFARELLEEGVNQSLPIRGGIAYDDYVWGDLIYGPAVVTAFQLQESQAWIGVVLDSSVTISHQDYTNLRLVCYPVPMPGKIIKLYNAISWKIPSSKELSIKLTDKGLTNHGEQINWY